MDRCSLFEEIMTIATSFPILVVEDDLTMWKRMERCLSSHATRRDFPVVIHHASCLVEAKQKFSAYNPFVLSVDMNFTLYPKKQGDGQNTSDDMGAQFLRWVTMRKNVKAVIYSGTEKGTVKDLLLLSHAYDSEKTLPLILQKSYNISDDLWARSLLDLLTTR